MSSPATPSIECEHCTHKATLACAGCKAAPTTAVDTFKTAWYFYTYRVKVFDKFVLSVERNGDHIETKIQYAFNQDEFFVPFPDEVCGDQADKQALLSCFACTDALAYAWSSEGSTSR